MTRDQKIIRAKVGLLELAKQLGNVSQACKMRGYGRDSFHRFKELHDTGGRWRCGSCRGASLCWRTGRRPRWRRWCSLRRWSCRPRARCASPMSCASAAIGCRPRACAGFGGATLSRRCEMRLKALEARAAQDGIVLTEGQLAAGEGQDREGSPWRVRERVSGLLRGVRHSFYLGTLKGVGRGSDRQTFVDTYSKRAFASVSERETPITAADLARTTGSCRSSTRRR
jgi:hypothetical protein